MPERRCLYGDIVSLNAATRTASFKTSDKEHPKTEGQTFPYLAGCWQAYHVWMVTELRWKWKEVTFLPSDASAERFLATDSKAGDDGQPTEEWKSVKQIGSKSGRSHIYKAGARDGMSEQTPISAAGVIPAGWDHEHCELCWEHIEPGDVGHVDPGEHWVCKSCYTQYVSAHDLSFLFQTNAPTP